MIAAFRLHIIIFILAAAAGAMSLDAQVRHVTAAVGRQAVDVYEFDFVDVQPQFPGGERGLTNFINQTRRYPYEAYHNRVQGRVLCSFIVGTDGKVSNVRVIRGCADESLNREAMRVISEMPRWSAGEVGGRAVPVRCVLPVAFRL